MKKYLIILPALALLVSCTEAGSPEQESIAGIEQGFLNPPQDCRPRVWWHWMNGNITGEGIYKDLHWMDRVGIGGFHCFDAGINTPQIVGERKVYMTPAWNEMFKYTLSIADSLGMEVTMTSSPGWSVTGGPWVSEEDAQKKLVWSETVIDGDQEYSGELGILPSVCGWYQNEAKYPDEPDKYRYCRDICVVAIKMPARDTARITESIVKTGFRMDYKVSDNHPTPDTDDLTDCKDVIDLSSYYNNGILQWDVPAGKWKVFRFGWSLLGHVNGPASPEATGLEVDKLNPEAMKRYYKNYFELYEKAAPGCLGKHITGIMIDSYESGRGTWTNNMEQEFKTRRGYDLRPWMPVLTGQIIGSSEMSERFLFDWRQTLGELMAENHYDLVNELIEPYQMKRYSEAHEERTAFTGDGMLAKRKATVPMSASWVRFNAGWYSTYPTAEADLREGASVAHIYGQNICAAESFTTNGRIGKWDGFGAYQCSPRLLKRVADGSMAQGQNMFIIHSSVHQPSDDFVPGLGLGPYGQWFNRHDTWAEEARPWTDYLSRSSYMLRQGRFVADVAYFYGEDKNITGRFMDERINFPAGWNYDFVNADVILNEFKAGKGVLKTKSGMEYRMLVIDGKLKYMSLPVLKKIREFADKGIIILGPRPERCANLMADDNEFKNIANSIWDSGRTNVFETGRIDDLLAANGIAPDVKLPADSLAYVHRTFRDGEVYWVANICSKARSLDLSFRTNSYLPHIWHPDTGIMEEASYSIDGDRTLVHLDFTRDDAQFIVFRGKPVLKTQVIPARKEKFEMELSGPWDIEFQKARNAPEKTVFDKLHSFSADNNPAIRYFSGTAVYTKDFSIEESFEEGTKAILDLGDVRELAHVWLNGQDLGCVWKSPFRTDMSEALSVGINHLEVRVIDSWANALIGDQVNSTSNTHTIHQFYTKESKPIPAGLLGPVTLITVTE